MNLKPNITNFELKKAKIIAEIKKSVTPLSEIQIFKSFEKHEFVLAEIKVILKYLLKSNEIDSKNKLYFILK